MQAYQKLIGSNGLQVALFPMDVMNITQGIDGEFSHKGSYAIDFVGTTPNYPLYAPCDLELINTFTAHAIYTSLRPVNFADGTIGILTIMLIHDDNVYTVGRKVKQGEPIANTGTTGNVTGDHIHIEVKKGAYEGLTQNEFGVWMMLNSLPPFNLLFINNTNIINDLGYYWKKYTEFGLPLWLYTNNRR